jgi:membrane peptidoglycan carboxypeptidase
MTWKVHSRRVTKSLKRALTVAVVIAVASTALLALGVWAIVHDEVSRLRSIASRATAPVPPVVAGAVLAAEDAVFLERPAFSLLALMPPSKTTLRCGPASIAYVMVRSVSPPRRALRWHIETSLATYVVSRLFTSEELFRMYANELYLGRIDGRTVRGVESASRAYFGKAARELTPAEAATIAAMMRSPSAFSPLDHPDRALARRDRVLERMLRSGAINPDEFQRGIKEPLPARLPYRIHA